MTDLKTIRIGREGLDLDISGGDLKLTSGLEGDAQRMFHRLSLAKGSWFLDLTEGVPWLQEVLVRNPDLGALQAVFIQRILTQPNIIRLERFNISFNNATGLFTLDFLAISSNGPIGATSEATNIAALLSLLLLQPLGGI